MLHLCKIIGFGWEGQREEDLGIREDSRKKLGKC